MSQIVIVDDQVTNRNIYTRLAATIEAGVVAKSFADPNEALEWLKHNSPDLVLTDYKMPQMDGAEFIRNLRAIPGAEEVPVVVITVYEDRTFRLRALEAGATDFLNSPVDHHEFVTRARNLLKLHRHQQLLASRATNLERELELAERSRQRLVRDSTERLAQVIDTLPVLIRATGPDSRVLFVNAYHTTFAGLDPASVVGQPATRLFGEEHGARSHALDRMVFETGRALPSYEEELLDADSVKHVFLTTKSPLKDPLQKVTGVLTSSLDISDRKKTEAHLHHLAHHDSLTDLPNRTLLREKMRQHIMRARRGDQLFALHLLDLDGFKAVNDLLGHSAGDRFIIEVSRRLRGIIRDSDTLARLGGDEFAILQSNVAATTDAADFAHRILTEVADITTFDGVALRSSASVGIAMHPTDGADAEDLLKNADLAMYRSKAEHGNAFCFFAADMQARARNDALLDAELRLALANEEFILYYQPQIDLMTGRIVGAEALLRWNRRGEGIVSPGVFLPRAEENGMIVPINEWVLREACREARAWQTSGLPPLTVSVNMSPVQFRKRNVPLLVARVLSETGLDPRRLDLELTETIVMQEPEAVASELQQLIELGVKISIDDFGTGYSSFGYVKRFPVSRLKIDQSFVRNVISDMNDAAIVRAIVTLGHSLDLEIIAEGVETSDQLAFLRAEGCDGVQGYYFGRPMPSKDFIARVLEEQPLARTA